jgi:biopolymer transport protein ExbB/TolQ
MKNNETGAPASTTRAAAAGLGLASLAILAAALVVGFWQAVYSFHAIGIVRRGDNIDAASQQVPSWVRSLMVDLSLVTPGLVALTAGWMVWGAWLILRRAPSSRLAHPSFPFPPRYKIFCVQMGLLGTLIGFVIAFKNPSLISKIGEQAKVLLQALSAALWSSVAGVALAYLVCPVIAILYQRLVHGRVTTGGSPVERFNDVVTDTANALERFQKSVTSLGPELDLQRMAAAVKELGALVGGLSGRVSAVEDGLKEFRKTLADHDRRLANAATAEALRRERESIEKQCASKTELTKLETKVDTLASRLDVRQRQARAAVRSLITRLAKVMSQEIE